MSQRVRPRVGLREIVERASSATKAARALRLADERHLHLFRARGVRAHEGRFAIHEVHVLCAHQRLQILVAEKLRALGHYFPLNACLVHVVNVLQQVVLTLLAELLHTIREEFGVYATSLTVQTVAGASVVHHEVLRPLLARLEPLEPFLVCCRSCGQQDFLRGAAEGHDGGTRGGVLRLSGLFEKFQYQCIHLHSLRGSKTAQHQYCTGIQQSYSIVYQQRVGDPFLVRIADCIAIILPFV